MRIAIDDTYGPDAPTGSTYVTGSRRTHVAVIFQDDEIGYVSEQISNCLNYLGSLTNGQPTEFHFADIFNRRGIWAQLDGGVNLRIIETFSEIYKHHRWKVVIQTVDDRTITDHPELLKIPELESLDSRDRSKLSLLLLCIKIRLMFKATRPPIHMIVDEGNYPPDTQFGKKIFGDWGENFSGKYASSRDEPLLQIADFIAFIINRSTHLSIKRKRTETDEWFLSLVGSMNIDCDDIKQGVLPKNFSVKDFDEIHLEDRQHKELE
jgi:hypothetical protein